ncbi:hypothetical protein JRQ81_008692 [Phrynocephalus forsythii]|uniref:Uncharacterized protein n=1 Tax=Phrynocephalus forsythii TaxID=171643 RepID=A0A9Q0XAI7_9SAUR|nr:hypothetical protein JRQ81_008692 [Phrynocephalus forsythii]
MDCVDSPSNCGRARLEAKLATAEEGVEVAAVEQQKEPRSYVGDPLGQSPSPGLPVSLAKVRDAKQGRQEALAQPHRTLGLIEQAKQGIDQKIQSGQEKLHQRWLQLRQKQPSEGAPRSLLLMPRLSFTLWRPRPAAPVCRRHFDRQPPRASKEKVSLVRENVDDQRASYTSATSFRDLSSAVLAQCREKVATARERTEELMEQLAQNSPLLCHRANPRWRKLRWNRGK